MFNCRDETPSDWLKQHRTGPVGITGRQRVISSAFHPVRCSRVGRGTLSLQDLCAESEVAASVLPFSSSQRRRARGEAKASPNLSWNESAAYLFAHLSLARMESNAHVSCKGSWEM